MISSNIPLLHFSFTTDPLSLFFIAVIAWVSLACSIFSINYMREMGNKVLFVSLYIAFIISMMLVATASNAFAFLIFWEVMTVLSFCLVIFEYQDEANRQAGFLYILMTHFGTGFIILAFALLYLATGSLEFSDWSHVALPESRRFWIFLFALIGFGTKAGIYPFHIWLPKAHPVAPSNVSALMSVVMIKTAIYMLIRFYFDFLADYAWWYGFIILWVGSISALFGVMYALTQHDLKKLLAYHSIENIGIILIGVGLAMIFNVTGHPYLTAFSLIGALYHTLNHAIFKGLLFLGAGSVLFATHNRDMETYGGLIKKMPYTAFFFLIGAISICALPPFNGFVSEWITYQALLLSNHVDNETLRIFSPIFASMLALTGAFAATCFVKVFGISFLGRARTTSAETAREGGFFMLFALGLLSLSCLILGIFPMEVIFWLDKVVTSLVGFSVYPKLTGAHGLVLTAFDYHFGRVSPLGLAVAGTVLAAGTWFMIKLIGGHRLRVFETWGCGLSSVSPTAQYTATGFTQPIKGIFPFFYRLREDTQWERHVGKYFFPWMSYRSRMSDVAELASQGLEERVMRACLFLRKFFHVGLIHIYLLYMMGTLMALLIWVIWL